MGIFSRSKSTSDTSTTNDSTLQNGQPSPFDRELEKRIQELGSNLLKDSLDQEAGMLSSQFWSDRLMEWTMKDEAFKVQLFRFVDTFPTLKTSRQVHDHLTDYLNQPGVSLPPFLKTGMKAGGLMKGALAKTVASQIQSMAGTFIAGTDANDALPKLQKLRENNIAFSIDLLGEACVSDAEAAAYRERYRDLLDHLPKTTDSWAPNDQLDRDHLGEIPRSNISVKISSLTARTSARDFEGTIRELKEGLLPLLKIAGERGVFVNFDMEHYELKDLTIELFRRCCDEVDFPAGIALQAYLRSGDEDAKKIIDWSKKSGRQVTVRLVKGAYWDFETIHAEQHGWPIPVWSRKKDTDACFERMTRQFIEAMPRKTDEGGVKLALGSHNARSIAVALALLEKHDLPQNALELQMLHGMAESIKKASVKQGLRVREYVPVGEMIPGMAYLVRRLLENTSNESWLKAGFKDDVDEEQLFASPHGTQGEDPGILQIEQSPERHRLSPNPEGVGDSRPFFSEPHRDFAEAEQREAFDKAIRKANVPRVKNDGTAKDAERIVGRLSDAWPEWRDTDAVERANMLCRAADIMRERRDELAGMIVKENGKGWYDADGDVCEAIDFMEFYARHAPRLFEPERLGKFVGEFNQQFYQPRGVAAVISPWNFPLAICCGMTTAALVTGNTVVVKPAEQTPGIARVMVDILYKAGVPKEVLAFLPGEGETVGASLVRDPRVDLIAFTGSRAVGLDIVKAAGETDEQQTQVKKVVCEMGGKNAIIVDSSADLDEAVLGVRSSAFGYQGQKCSACSRAIVLDTAYDTFLERLVESTRSLVIGDPIHPGTDVGHVIDQEAKEKIESYIEIGKQEGTLEIGLDVPEGLEEKVGRPFVGPHVFSGIENHHRLAHEEVFGPVLAVMKVSSFDEALQVANSTRYKLTGGIYSRKPSHLERARREFRVGNLYLNRPSTGSLVGRQPFGGFGMSGVGSKSGSRDYLLQFVVPRSVTENTIRRGFAPGLQQ